MKKGNMVSTSVSASAPNKKGKSFQLPHIYVILFVFSAIAAIATYFVPAGQYDRVPGPNGRTAIDPDSFRVIDSDPVGIVEFMMAIPNGFIHAAEVVFFTFIIGGMFMVIRETGIIETGVDKLTRHFAKRSILVIPVLMLVFAVIASLIGTQELSLVYVPVILPLLIALRFDSVTEAFSARSANQVAVLEVGEDERRFGDLADLAGAGGDVLQGPPASAEYGESAFAQAA
jgi:uncharacterized ion transporter superfamily protein YfcC